MSVPTVCRVCLVNNLNLHGVQNDLQTTYERITREKYNKVGYPLSMCYICLSVLRKCQRFMETARDTNSTLKQWHNQQNEVAVVNPLCIYSASKIDSVSIECEGVLDHVIKTEVKSEPDDIENNTYLDVEKTDINEETDSSNSPNDSTYIDDEREDDNDRKIDPLSIDNVDFDTKSSLAIDTDDYTRFSTIIKVESLHGNDVPTKKLVRNKAKPQHHTPETPGETDANSETSNNITPFSTSQIQPENMKQGKKQIKPVASKSNCNKNKTAKLNKIVREKKSSVQNKIKKTINTVKNIENLDTLSLKMISSEKTDINKINTIPSNTAVADSMLNANSSKQIDLYKYCEVCNLKCATKAVLAKHMRRHDNSRPLVCDVCHYRFDKLCNLNRHKSVIHKIGTTKEYFCDICNHKSSGKSDLARHIRIHSGNKPFTCKVCSYECTKKNSLKIHMRTHTGEKPYSCNLCDYKCRQNSHLKLHMKIHTGEKPFSCNFCSYKCILKSVLKSHMRIHTGEKPFSCNFCSYKCTLKCILKSHIRTHTGEKPFTCRICSYKSARKDALTRHMRIHTYW